MEKLIILAVILFTAFAVPTMARMPATYETSNNNVDNIAMVIVEETAMKNTHKEAALATAGCANTGESCWNGVPCCSGNLCSEGPFNSVCVEIVYPPPWDPNMPFVHGSKRSWHI